MNDISATALTTISCHVADAKSSAPLLDDQSAIRIFEIIQKKNPLINTLIRPKKSLVTHICLRAKKYDEVARFFSIQNPGANIINIGCGFDNRFERIDDGKMHFYDLDLPEVISIKSQLFPESDRYQQIASSVFDTAWMWAIPHRPTLLLAEGVFMYFPEQQIQDLFANLKQHLAPCEIFFEVFNAKWLTGWRKKSVEKKLRKQLKFGKDAGFHFGIPDSESLSAWDEDYQFLADWSYLDSNHPRLGVLRLFRKWDLFRKMQWSVHYGIHGNSDE